MCSILDLPRPVQQNAYKRLQDKLATAAKDEAAVSKRKAVNEELLAEPSLDSYTEASTVSTMKVKGDGTWQKRGFSSKNCAVSLIGANTEKVIDYEVLSSHCTGCSQWQKKYAPATGREWQDFYTVHKLVCTRNYSGTPGGMKSTGVLRIFKRSVANYSVQYTDYIGDEDSKTFYNICRHQPYGPEVEIKKLECIGHVGKRFGYQMKKLKVQTKGKKLTDGKGLCGKGRLTDRVIGNMQTYYTGDIIWYHMGSTDECPKHQFCPVGRTSWCKYNHVQALDQLDSFQHKKSLPPAVLDTIRPIFVRMTSAILLKRCLGGHTQNSNESFNNIPRKVCPKAVFIGLDTRKFGATLSTILYNEGMSGILRVMQRAGMIPGTNAVTATKRRDKMRQQKAHREMQESIKKTRRIYRRLQINLPAEEEYKAGAF